MSDFKDLIAKVLQQPADGVFHLIPNAPPRPADEYDHRVQVTRTQTCTVTIRGAEDEDVTQEAVNQALSDDDWDTNPKYDWDVDVEDSDTVCTEEAEAWDERYPDYQYSDGKAFCSDCSADTVPLRLEQEGYFYCADCWRTITHVDA